LEDLDSLQPDGEKAQQPDGDSPQPESPEPESPEPEKRPRAAKPWQYALITVLLIVLAGFVSFNIILFTNYNNLGQLLRVVMVIQDQYLEEVPVSKLVDGAISGMVETLDPYSSYQNESENRVFMQELSGRIGGIGVLISSADPSRLLVVKVFADSPAGRSEIQPGDVIIGVDGRDVTATDQDTAIALIRGEPGTDVSLEVLREEEDKIFTVTIRRDYVVVPTVEGRELPGHPEIAVIAISNFSEQTGNEFAQVLQEMDIDSKAGLILDLRYNPGGEVHAALKTAGYLVPGQEIFYIVDRNGEESPEVSDSPYLDKPLVVLVNENSASAAEIVAGAVKDYQSGTLVGVTTYGKGVMQTVFPVEAGSLKLTTNKYLTPGRNDIHGKGIEPDVAVELAAGEDVTVLPEQEPLDSQMREAARVLLEKIQGLEIRD
jgi:carboxyl-terminal processing protease